MCGDGADWRIKAGWRGVTPIATVVYSGRCVGREYTSHHGDPRTTMILLWS